jgi:3-hydroxyacyl-CoA dehydrogenase/enoyl-CoA hydratase/3-hydroxybutyryl-CoA epimerase
MEQFLRLMFDPVAGRMVRSLFLERLRADRELAPTVGIERLRVGPISAARSAWTHALAKLKLPQDAVATLPADTADLVDQQGRTQRIALRVLDEEPAASSGAYAVLAPLGPYGRVIEIVAAADAADAAAALAVKLRALPWRTPGPTSLLQALRGRPLEEQQRIAHAALPAAGDPAFVDVAACLSGVSPAWSGGPLSWQPT